MKAVGVFHAMRIARKAGGSTDTSRDHDYTDRAALDAFTASLARDLARPLSRP